MGLVLSEKQKMMLGISPSETVKNLVDLEKLINEVGSKKSSAQIKEPLKTGKHGNIKTSGKHGQFDSILEENTYLERLQEQRRGKIRNLCRQITFPLFSCDSEGNMVRVGSYRVDFMYERSIDGNFKLTVEDVKGRRLGDQSRKEKLFQLCYPGIDLVISGPNNPMTGKRNS